LEQAEARDEIRKLADGELDGRALKECTLCYAGNQLRPGLEPEVFWIGCLSRSALSATAP
jgi:hypothetical protein